jgi:hypothetical protein
MSQTPILESLGKIKDDFYSNESKNLIFKKDQKNRISNAILQEYNLDVLLSNTIYRIGDTNRIFVDYNVFKMYVNESIESHVVDYLINKMLECVRLFGAFEIHIDLNGFTVSGLERYKLSLQMFYMKCCSKSEEAAVEFEKSLIKLCIYNTPSIMNSINQLFRNMISSETKGKIFYFTKAESKNKLEALLNK